MSRELLRKSNNLKVFGNEGFWPGSLFLVNKDLQMLQGNDPNRSFKFFIPLKKGTVFMVCDICVFHMDYMKAMETHVMWEVHENNKQEIDTSWDPFNPVESYSSYSTYITPVSVFVKILVGENLYYMYLENVAAYLKDWYFTRIKPPYTNT